MRETDGTAANMGPELATLAGRLPGRVATRGSDAYDVARRVFARQVREREPAAVLRPCDAGDLTDMLAWANAGRKRVAVRSGGHAFDGFPIRDGELLLDLSALDRVEVDDAGRVHAMPGATVKTVARALDGTGLGIPLGDCPMVGLGGLVTGGGFGYATRHCGLATDFLREVTVIAADGRRLVASDRQNEDVFWSCRGGAGCTGIAVEFTFDTFRPEVVTGVTLGWRWEHAAEAILLFDAILGRAPTTLDLKLKIRTTGADRFIDMASAGPADAIAGTPLVHVDGQFLGPREEAIVHLAPLLEHPAAEAPEVREETYYEAMLQLVPLDLFDDPAPATLRPTRVASDFTRGALGAEEAGAIVRFVEQAQTAEDLCGGAILIEPADAAVHRTAPSATAFPHRTADLLLEWEIFEALEPEWRDDGPADALLGAVRAGLRRVLTGARYVNYADRLDRPVDWWGANLPQLERLSRHWDERGTLISRLRP